MNTKRILIHFNSPYFQNSRECFRGIYEYALRHCPDWRFVNNPSDFYHSLTLNPADIKQADGLIFVAYSENSLTRAATKAGIPTINVTLPDQELPFPVVTPNNEAIGRVAGSYLANCPLVKQTLYFGPDNRRSELRLAAFNAAIKKAGLPPPITLVDSLQRGEQAIQKHLQTTLWKLTRQLVGRLGVFAFSDSFAHAVTETAYEMGIQIPHQVVVLGCDDDDTICTLSHPPLSSIPIPSRQVGETAAQLLQRLMHGEKVQRLTLLPPSPPVERLSSSPLITNDPIVTRALAIMQNFYHKGLNIKELVQNVGGARRTLEVRFRKALGRTPLEELQRIRIEKAVQLLANPELGIAEVGYRCGFASPYYFTQAFHKHTGKAPTYYRTPTDKK